LSPEYLLLVWVRCGKRIGRRRRKRRRKEAEGGGGGGG
jgi:hypothetical protein